MQLELVPVPSAWQFIAAHSLEDASKSAGAREVYNTRTKESAQAFRSIADAFGLDASIRDYGALIEEVGPEPLLREAERILDATLFRRVRHIVTETDRVFDAVGALSRADLSTFGPLLCDSHRSLRDDYEVSTSNLDELVETAVASGASGARLTGAGFGGCAIVACDVTSTTDVLEGLTARFYERRKDVGEIDAVLFPVQPAAGAHVFSL